MVYSYTGSLVYKTIGSVSDSYSFGQGFQAGTYIIKVYQDEKTCEKVVIKK